MKPFFKKKTKNPWNLWSGPRKLEEGLHRAELPLLVGRFLVSVQAAFPFLLSVAGFLSVSVEHGDVNEL